MIVITQRLAFDGYSHYHLMTIPITIQWKSPVYNYSHHPLQQTTAITIDTSKLKTLFSVHIDKHLLRVHLLGGKLSAELAANLSGQRVLTVDALAALLSVHRLRSGAVQRRQLSLLANVVQKLHRRLRSQTLLPIASPLLSYKVVVVDLHHGGVRARSETLHLQEREHAVLRRLAVLDAQLLLHRLHDLLGSAEHARGRTAQLDKELAHLLPTVQGPTLPYVLYMV